MTFELSLEEGEYLVNLARKSIETMLKTGERIDPIDAPHKMKEPSGVFVTLNQVNGEAHRLRGCIGFPYPVKPLVEAVIDSAISSALRDPRFKPVSIDEMESIVVEVSILTPPERILVKKKESYPEHIKIGRDGLIVSSRSRQGLLLPQVAVDLDLDSEEFLTQCCLKAGLAPDAWLMPGIEVSKFRAIIFSESNPKKSVRRIDMHSK